jgi:hypothetical protein
MIDCNSKDKKRRQNKETELNIFPFKMKTSWKVSDGDEDRSSSYHKDGSK